MYSEITDSGFSKPDNSNVQTINVDLIANVDGATTSSWVGGNSLVITGLGFHENTEVTVCGKPCTIANPETDVSISSITC